MNTQQKAIVSISTLMVGLLGFYVGHTIANGLMKLYAEPVVTLPVPQQPVEYLVPPDEPDESEVICMSKAVYHEARGESTAGKIAVMHVIANRAENKTICEVVHEGQTDTNGNPIRGKCQFSWWCDGRSDDIKDWSEFEAIRATARDFIANRPVDITDGSKWFRTLSVTSRPYGETAVRIDNHVFYK